MKTLEKCFDLIESKFGKIDNVKFLLGDHAHLSEEAVVKDLLEVAEKIAAGEAEPRSSFAEPNLNKK